MLVNDSTSPPSYISVGQTRLKVHDGTNNEVRSRISRDASVMSKDQIQHLILELAGCNPNPEQMIALIESRRRRGFPAIEVCREIYIWLDVDDYWQRDHAYAKTLEQCYCKIESSVNGVMDEVLELMLNEMTDYQVAFDIWLEAATQLMRLVRRLNFHGRETETTKFGRDVTDLGAGSMVMDGLSSLLPALMVFEYSSIRDDVLGVLRKKISPSFPYSYRGTTPSLSAQLKAESNALADFDAIRAQWKARGVEIEQERADADRQDLPRDQGEQEHEYASQDGEDDEDDYLFDELDDAKAADEINRAISAHLRI
jgi:hypothetical protein